MPALQIRINVELDGQDPFVVIADQRDLAKYEVWDGYGSAGPHTEMRYVAWSACTRLGKTKLSWDKFNAEMIEAVDADKAEDTLDPTKTDRSEEV